MGMIIFFKKTVGRPPFLDPRHPDVPLASPDRRPVAHRGREYQGKWYPVCLYLWLKAIPRRLAGIFPDHGIMPKLPPSNPAPEDPHARIRPDSRPRSQVSP